MADVSSLTDMISALRAEIEQDSITPERLGYLLQCIVNLLSSYADEVWVRTLEQKLNNALSRVSTLEGHDVELDSEINELQAIVGSLGEVYCTESQYNELVDSGTVDANKKYYIYES